VTLLARLDRLPLSRPHYRLLLIGGLGYTFDAMDTAVVAFLLPSVREVWQLDNAQLGLIGSAAPFGFLFGAVAAGLLGDRIGRKQVMMYALAFYAVFSVIAAFSPSYELFLVARVLAGAGAGAESAIIAPFLSEFVPARRRGWFVGALAGFFSFGFVGAALIGRFVVTPLPEGWRIAQIVTALPIVMLLWWRRSLPESPRYLLANGRRAEAEQVVAAMERDAGLYSYTPEVFPTWIRASGTGLASAFGRVGSILAPTIIGLSAASLGFGGVFGLTTAVLSVGVVCVIVFGLSTAGRSLEELTERVEVSK